MAVLTIALPPREKQTEFNLRRWEEVCADPVLAKIEGRVETDRHGRIVMMPPPNPFHGIYQMESGVLLKTFMKEGRVLSECPISTSDGVRAADVAWVSPECMATLGEEACFPTAPEICVEVISPRNSVSEIAEKIALYFDAGAKEVWTCDASGRMAFCGPAGKTLRRSQICPKFPGKIILT